MHVWPLYSWWTIGWNSPSGGQLSLNTSSFPRRELYLTTSSTLKHTSGSLGLRKCLSLNWILKLLCRYTCMEYMLRLAPSSISLYLSLSGCFGSHCRDNAVPLFPGPADGPLQACDAGGGSRMWQDCTAARQTYK